MSNKATRLSDVVGVKLSKNIDLAMRSLWKIDGMPGIWKFAHAVKDDAKPVDGEAIAEYGEGEEHNYRASFIRDNDIERAMKLALGMEVMEATEAEVEEVAEEMVVS